MYVQHYTKRFMDLPSDYVTGFLGAVLAQPGGRERLNEAHYFDSKKVTAAGLNPTKPRGYKSPVFIKAAAISCVGCNIVKKYATFTCPMPLPAKG